MKYMILRAINYGLFISVMTENGLNLDVKEELWSAVFVTLTIALFDLTCGYIQKGEGNEKD